MASSCFKVVNVFFFVVNGQVTKTLRRDQTIHHCLISPLSRFFLYSCNSHAPLNAQVSKALYVHLSTHHGSSALKIMFHTLHMRNFRILIDFQYINIVLNVIFPHLMIYANFYLCVIPGWKLHFWVWKFLRSSSLSRVCW